MTLEKLQNDMIAARKSADKARVSALTNMIDIVKKASLTPKGRVEITEQLVNESLIKYQKIVQEQYDTCPNGAEYMERKNQYYKELEIVKEYAPQLINDPVEIKKIVIDEITGITLCDKNRGVIMKMVMPKLKGKADMKIAQQVITDLIKKGE